jgi:formylglycine-generating enzyme required for sulfatase activity
MRPISILLLFILFTLMLFAQDTARVNIIEPEMVFVQGGSFMMGSVRENESPIHEVFVDDFYIGAYEITQKEWLSVMDTNPSKFRGEINPVENVSWIDIQEYIRKLNAGTGRKYRLPTEAEWEYAAHGGMFVSSWEYRFSGSNVLGQVGWYGDNSEMTTHPVGQKLPNALGIYDMSGNVYEYCSDWYAENYYSVSPEKNPTGPEIGKYRVVRGGSWRFHANASRCTSRYNYYSTDSKCDYIGFRLAQEK